MKLSSEQYMSAIANKITTVELLVKLQTKL